MKYQYFTFENKLFKITHTRETFKRTKTGRNWKSKPTEETRETVPPEFYENFVRSIPFFNGFMGGTCRAEHNYTGAGYIPTKITTISPDRAEKHIDYFTFEYIGV